MRISWLLIYAFLVTACNEKKMPVASSEMIEKDPQKFGNIQPLLEKNSRGETIRRIDSTSSKDSLHKHFCIVYYITDHGPRELVWSDGRINSVKMFPSSTYCIGKDGRRGHVLSHIDKNGRAKAWAQDSNYSLVINLQH